MCQTSTTDVRCHYAQFSERNQVSILINTELRSIIVFHGRNFVRHLGICNPIFVKLLQAMSGVISRNLKNDVSTINRFPGVHKRGIYTDTHTDTHISIAIGEMQCVAFRLKPDQ